MSSTELTPTGASIVKAFQLNNISISKKSDKAYGEELCKYIVTTLGGNTGYYFSRNARYKRNRDLANGIVDTTKFMDLLVLICIQ
jgi:hypothetical protein